MLLIRGRLADVRQGIRFEKTVCDAYVVVEGGENYPPAMYQISLTTDGSEIRPYIGREVEIGVDVRAWKDRLYFEIISFKGQKNETK